MAQKIYSVDFDGGILVASNRTELIKRMLRENIRGEIKISIIPSEDELMEKLLRGEKL